MASDRVCGVCERMSSLCCRDGYGGIELILSTSEPNGLLLFMGDSQTDYLALGLNDGILQLE